MVSLTIITGIMTYSSLIITFILGILTHRGKPVLKYHRFFAYLTLLLATTHVSIVVRNNYFI